MSSVNRWRNVRHDVPINVCVFGHLPVFFPAPVGLFSRSQLWGTQGGHLYTTTQVLGPGRAPWRVLWRSKSRNLARNHGVAFRGARAEQDDGKRTCQLFVCSTVVKALYLAAMVQEQSHVKFVWTTAMRVWTLHTRVFCVLWYVCVCVGACGFVYWCAGTFSLLLFALSACCCCCRIMPSVSHRPSRSLVCGSHGTTAVAQQVGVDNYLLCVR